MSCQPRFHGPGAPRRAVRGVGLIEVLVAILVLAVGMLGIAALQATTLRNSKGALERSQATIQTYGIFDSMRANAAAARAGDYNIALTCAPPAVSDLATRDIADWIGNLENQMGNVPGTCGRIESLGGDVFRITVQWDEERGGGGSQTLVTETRL